MTWAFLIGGVVAFAGTLATTPAILVILQRRGILDEPNERSSHIVAVPRGAGLAVTLGTLAGFIVGGFAGAGAAWLLIAGSILLATVGLLDDVRGLPAIPRLVIQLTVGISAGAWVVTVIDRTALTALVLGAVAALWIAAYVNAFNFMDGINGLSGVQAIVSGVALVVVGVVQNTDILLLGGLVMAAAAAGFLPFNFPKARIFLGDVGSYFLGGWFALLVVIGLAAGVPFEAVVAPAAIYVADTGWTLIKRVKSGESWYTAHRTHIYQRLGNLGWSHGRTTIFVGSLSAIGAGLGLVSLGGVTVLRVLADMLASGVVVLYLLLPRLVGKRRGLSARAVTLAPSACR